MEISLGGDEAGIDGRDGVDPAFGDQGGAPDPSRHLHGPDLGPVGQMEGVEGRVVGADVHYVLVDGGGRQVDPARDIGRPLDAPVGGVETDQLAASGTYQHPVSGDRGRGGEAIPLHFGLPLEVTTTGIQCHDLPGRDGHVQHSTSVSGRADLEAALALELVLPCQVTRGRVQGEHVGGTVEGEGAPVEDAGGGAEHLAIGHSQGAVDGTVVQVDGPEHSPDGRKVGPGEPRIHAASPELGPGVAGVGSRGGGRVAPRRELPGHDGVVLDEYVEGSNHRGLPSAAVPGPESPVPGEVVGGVHATDALEEHAELGEGVLQVGPEEVRGRHGGAPGVGGVRDRYVGPLPEAVAVVEEDCDRGLVPVFGAGGSRWRSREEEDHDRDECQSR